MGGGGWGGGGVNNTRITALLTTNIHSFSFYKMLSFILYL